MWRKWSGLILSCCLSIFLFGSVAMADPPHPGFQPGPEHGVVVRDIGHHDYHRGNVEHHRAFHHHVHHHHHKSFHH